MTKYSELKVMQHSGMYTWILLQVVWKVPMAEEWGGNIGSGHERWAEFQYVTIEQMTFGSEGDVLAK